jgi:GNAT superfamily N-acetyltransferase
MSGSDGERQAARGEVEPPNTSDFFFSTQFDGCYMIEIIDFSEEYAPQYFVCLEEWNSDLAEARAIKEKWYRIMTERGLRVKVARADDGMIDGMIEFMPIEYSFAKGSDAFFVNCIWVHGYEGKGRGNRQGKGIGKALLSAVEEDVRSLGQSGLAVWGLSEPFWMNAPWFRKQGYETVDQFDWYVLLWKPFKPDAVSPKWHRGEFKPKHIPGKVTVTAFFSGQCCSENAVYMSAKKAADEFGDRVHFEVIDMSRVENIRKYGRAWRLDIDGENLFDRHVPTYAEIKAKIEEKLFLLR